MAADSFHILLQSVYSLHHEFARMVDMGFLVFARLLGFMLEGPALGRKDIPFTVKVGISLLLTVILIWVLPPTNPTLIQSDNWWIYTVQVGINITIGWVIGFLGATVMDTISAAGYLMNNQMGLSSAMMFDPSTRQQVGLTEKLLSMVGLIIFINMGGMYWILSALVRSFEVFPLHVVKPDFVGEINLDYVIQLTGGTIEVAMLMVAPVMVVTIAVDLMLGIINRLAQQIQVFQLSFGLKPSIGIAAFLAILPVFFKVVENFFHDHAAIF
jgi:flagellar biosynthetic protein FliR